MHKKKAKKKTLAKENGKKQKQTQTKKPNCKKTKKV
jgi:hypothetical protein